MFPTEEIITKNKLLSPKERLVIEAVSEVRGSHSTELFQKLTTKSSQRGEPLCFYERIIVPLVTISDCELFRSRDQIFSIYMKYDTPHC